METDEGLTQTRVGKLTDDDLNVIAGTHDKLVGKLQERYGSAKDEAQREADEWIKTAGDPSREPHFTGGR